MAKGVTKVFTKTIPRALNPKGIGQTLSKVVTNPGRAALAVVSGGLSEVARAVPGVKTVAKPVLNLANTVAATGLQTFSGGLYGLGAGFIDSTLNRPTAPANTGVQPMAFNIGGILNSVNQGFKGFGGVGEVISAGAGIASNFFPQPAAQGLPAIPVRATPVMAARPMAPAVAAGTAVTRGFFSKFPNLSVGLQQLRNRGIRVNRSRLHSILKRFGPEVLVTGGILTAAAVNELMLAGPGHRRMNVGNVKALRRSMRRVEGFHKLCSRADMLRSRGRRRAKC